MHESRVVQGPAPTSSESMRLMSSAAIVQWRNRRGPRSLRAALRPPSRARSLSARRDRPRASDDAISISRARVEPLGEQRGMAFGQLLVSHAFDSSSTSGARASPTRTARRAHSSMEAATARRADRPAPRAGAPTVRLRTNSMSSAPDALHVSGAQRDRVHGCATR